MTRASVATTTGRDPVIVSAVRTAIGLTQKGSLADTRAEDLGRSVIRAAVQRIQAKSFLKIEDVILGCAMQEGEQGRNIARAVSLYAGLPASVPGLTVNRSCASGLQAIAYAADRIRLGEADVLAAGGVESGSRVPSSGLKTTGHPMLAERVPEFYKSPGQLAEEAARRVGITRDMQDEYAALSHQRASHAIAAGHFQEEIVPLKVHRQGVDHHGQPWGRSFVFCQDEGVRSGVTAEQLGLLKPSYARDGTVTSANEAPPGDGAAALVLMSGERAGQLGAAPLATIRGFGISAAAPEQGVQAQTDSIRLALHRAGLSLLDIRVIELDEAHAAACIHLIRTLGLPPELTNVNGGAIALGRPGGCTGARLAVSLIHELRRRGGGFGLVSMGASGGIGAAAVLEVHL